MAPPKITDVCLVTHDIQQAIDFYCEKLGFTLDSNMPGFADFSGRGVVLALWDAAVLRETTNVPSAKEPPTAPSVMLAVELDSPGDIDQTYTELLEKGVEFYGPPADYPWNARCVYFPGPSGEFWEFFAWYEGGKPGREDHHSGAATTIRTDDQRSDAA